MSAGRRSGPAGAPRRIIHVDMDAFYASIEQRDDPALQGRPVIVAWKGARSVVCAASYEARPFGVRSAMPALRAARLCPDAVFVPPDFTRYRAVSQQVREILRRHADRIEPLSLDEAYLDVTANKTGLPSATAVARVIREQIRDELRLTASAGVAPNKFIAKLASDARKPDGLFVVKPAQVDAFLLPLPVARIPGVGRVTDAQLAALGIRTIADLRAAPLEDLCRRFGALGQRLHALARGEDDRPVEADLPTRSISAEDTFEADVPLAGTAAAIERLARRVWDAAAGEPRRARTVVLKLKTAQFRVLTRRETPAAMPASADGLVALALALRDRVGLPPGMRYRLVGVGLTNFGDAGEPQPGLFDPG